MGGQVIGALVSTDAMPTLGSINLVKSEGYALSQRKRKLIEQGFGWAKTVGGIRQVMVRGIKRVDHPASREATLRHCACRKQVSDSRRFFSGLLLCLLRVVPRLAELRSCLLRPNFLHHRQSFTMNPFQVPSLNAAPHNLSNGLLQRYPQLGHVPVSRRSLLALGSALGLGLVGCEGGGDGGSSSAVNAGVVVTTLAGSGSTGGTNGTGTAASFNFPAGVAVDSSGTVYVADMSNHLIRTITSAGVVITLAGSGSIGSTNGTGTAASFYNPQGVAVDSSGTVYVADTGNHLIRTITSAGVVTTLAGTGSIGSTNGTGTAASFNYPFGVAVDSSGTVYVADTGNQLIRKITSAGVVTTLAGSGSIGSTNDTGTSASFAPPYGVAVDSNGTVYVADTNNHLIRKITSAGVVTTLAGTTGISGSANGTGTAASFNTPRGVAVDASGTVYVTDQTNQLIRKITSAGVVTTLAGSGSIGSTNGTGTAASFNYPYGVAVDSSGTVYVADYGGHLIRKIS